MVQPSSIDVRLDKFFRLFDNHKYPVIDPSLDQADLTRLVEVDPAEGFVLHPGEFVLGSTLEMVALPVDLGFTGHVTLELSNVATLPIMLWPGMKIGQLAFFRLSASAENPYGSDVHGSHYQGQRGPTASRSFQNFHRADV